MGSDAHRRGRPVGDGPLRRRSSPAPEQVRCWGYRAPAADPPYTRYFNNVSPGHVRLDFGERAKHEAGRFFRQKLDLYHGQVVITLGGEAGARLKVWGYPSRKILVMEVNDPDALETWWMVRDPADTLDGIRAIFPEFIRLSAKYKQDHALRNRCERVLAALPNPSLGLWNEESVIRPAIKVYSPAAALGKFPKRINYENPALYCVYPFGLSHIGSDDYDLAHETFQHRIFPLRHGWSMDAIWAARMGLGQEAWDMMGQHARRYNRFRYGGWDSNDNSAFPGQLAITPFTDAGGLSAFALNESLLQSHGEVIRITPAVTAGLSGIFQLRAEGGFLVAVEFENLSPRFARIESLQGRTCTLANPWPGECVVRQGHQRLVRSSARKIRFKTTRNGVYLIEPASRPLSQYVLAPVQNQPNQRAGLPGRD